MARGKALRPFTRALWLAAAVLLAAPACTVLRESAVPIPSVAYPAAGSEARVLILLLPGARDEPRKFERQGFVDALRRVRPDADVVAVDAHMGYYRNEVIDVRIWEDFLAPAATRYEEIWLLGVSLGGIGAVGVTARYPREITGAVLLAPYLGPKELIADIEDADGPRHWRADEPDDALQEFWTWLQGHDPTREPRLYLGFGSGDRLARGCRQLASLLPGSQVVEIPGGHDWRTWSRLLDAFLELDTFGKPVGELRHAPQDGR